MRTMARQKKPEPREVRISLGGTEHVIRVNFEILEIEGDGQLTYVVPADPKSIDAVRALGMDVLNSRGSGEKKPGGLTNREILQSLVRLREAFGVRDRREDREVLFTQWRGTDATIPSTNVDVSCGHWRKVFRKAIEARGRGEYADMGPIGKLGPREFIETLLGLEATKLLMRANYFGLLTVEEQSRYERALDVLHDASASLCEKGQARADVQRLEDLHDQRYRDYYELRAELLAGERAPEEVKREFDNLRKRKRHPHMKDFARLLTTEARDASENIPYELGMAMVLKRLKDEGLLEPGPDEVLAKFMHRGHPFLCDIVPATHPIGQLLLQSQAFRRAMRRVGEEMGSDAALCDLAGSILAACDVYRLAVAETRHEEGRLAAKRKRRTREGMKPEDSYGETRDGRAASDTGMEVLRESKPGLTEEEIRGRFGEDAAKIVVYMRRKGLCGYAKARVSELAGEYGVHRATIHRWCQEAESILQSLQGRQ